MARISEIISFYKNCFEEENKGGGIANFLSSKVENHTLIKGEDEHISGLLPYTPIDEKIAKKLQTQAKLYEKEKELIYGSHFLLGRYTGFRGKSRRLIAPLILYPAEIIFENELYFIQADFTSATFNPVILELIKGFNPDFDEVAFYKNLPDSHIGMRENGKLSRLIERELPGTDATFMVDYPHNVSQYKINKNFRDNTFDSTYQLVPCSGFGIVKKSVKTRSTLSELDRLAQSDTVYSAPIQSLFNPDWNQKNPPSDSYTNPAAILNDAQEQVIDVALKYNISVAIGPPGTGKSFTIANLATSMISQGKSVLICSRNDGAVNVIEDKIEALLGTKNMCMRGGKTSEVRELKKRLQFLLSRGQIKENNRKNREHSKNDHTLRSEKRIAELRQDLKRFAIRFEQADIEELSTGESILKYDSSDSLWNRIVRYFLAQRVNYEDEWLLWNTTDLYLKATDDLIKANKDHINFLYSKRLYGSIAHNRHLLRNYLNSLRASNTARRKHFLEITDIQKLFDVFPIWLTTTKDVGKILPLQKEMFDLVIIDEASQCDISTCIPLLQRAKNAVIVGDPKQLRHISFLSRSKQRFLQVSNGFSDRQKGDFVYRDKSILDLAEDKINEQAQINFLDEHYRSRPELIAFSNAHFYYNSLKIMTNNLQDKSHNLFQLHVNGKRNKNGVNQTEIDRIICEVKKIVEGDKNTVVDQKQTIGILSPFRAQVDQIIESIQHHFKLPDIENHKILVGTAHSFQGEERDVMFISFALDDDSHPSAFHFLNQEDVFNVSITRAKNKQYLVSSFNKNNLPVISLLRKYYDSILLEKEPVKNQIAEKDQFSREVCAYVQSLGYDTRTGYSIAGVIIDIVIEHDMGLLGIDLVGFPGPFEKTIDLYKYKALARAGIKMIPIPYSLWRFKRTRCEERICELLDIALPENEHEG